MTELDELEEINIGPNLPARPDKRRLNALRGMAAGRASFQSKPKWLRQLGTAKATAARIAKARAT